MASAAVADTVGQKCAGGLVPNWWNKALKQLSATFNARAESVVDRPMSRDAFRRHRCIIPGSGYYEWIARPDGKQPYFISAADGGVLSFAGLWDRWKNPETGERVASCTIIVADANALTRPIHRRMPVLLDKADFGSWLSGAADAEILGRPRTIAFACGRCRGGSTRRAAAMTIRR